MTQETLRNKETFEKDGAGLEELKEIEASEEFGERLTLLVEEFDAKYDDLVMQLLADRERAAA